MLLVCSRFRLLFLFLCVSLCHRGLMNVNRCLVLLPSRRFCANPVYVIIDVRPGVEGIPTTAYITAEEVEADGKEIQKTFKHLSSSVGELRLLYYNVTPIKRV